MLRERLDHREKPSLILHGRGKIDVRTEPIISANAKIGYCAASSDKNLADLLVSEIELNSIPRREPIVAPRLRSLTTAADPTSDNVAVVRIAASPSRVEIEISGCDRTATWRYVRVDAFCAQIQLIEPRKVRKV